MFSVKRNKLCFSRFWIAGFFLFMTSSFLSAQIFDDFSDGNFTSNPEWSGDTSKFKITSSSAIPPEMKPALQLNGDEADTTTLYLSNSLVSNTEWRFWIKLSFNTSANNYARVYLVSDEPDLKDDLNGYFVQIGGPNDSISLQKQTGLTSEVIIHSTYGYTGNSTNILRIKVTRDEAGNWTLFSDNEGGYNFQEEGTAYDDEYASTSYFGIYCKYTSSNATKFYFDDFYVNEIVADTVPPEIENVAVVSQSFLDVFFNEPVESTSASNLQNYFVNNGIGNPYSAIFDEVDKSLVHLEFQQPFIPETENIIVVSDIEDLAGNQMDSDTATFTYFEPATVNPYDVVINEIMADVNPAPANLPEADFLELYNRTSSPVNLEGWTIKLKENGNPISFPHVVIRPDSFLIVVKTSDTAAFEPYGAVAGLPGFSLNNESKVVLRNEKGDFIHSVSYTKSWYKDEDKQEGGWSLEMIDPDYACAGEQNWMATIDENGGTPGCQNSVFMQNISFPEITEIESVSLTKLKVKFSHFMDSLSLVNPAAYFVSDGFGSPVTAVTENAFFDEVILEFLSSFELSKEYILTIKDTISDCTGNFIEINSNYPFAIPGEAKPYDIVINEILADPNPPVGLPEYEFIEIYNSTDEYLGIKDWKLLIGTVEKELTGIVLAPGKYLILTSENAKPLYNLFGDTYGLSSLALPNSGALLKLINSDGEVISSVSYDISWYQDEVKAEGGWSLEQIDPLNPCSGEGNWSEAVAEQGGTPGAVNSVDGVNETDPQIRNITIIDNSTIELFFDRAMDAVSLTDIQNYEVDKGIGNPASAYPEGTFTDRVILSFEFGMIKRTVYTLTVKSEMKDCTGNTITATIEKQFGIPEPPEKDNIIINEVLFNPLGDGVDFVEIYNRSEKIISPDDLKLGTVKDNQYEPDDTSYKSLPGDRSMLLSGEYLVLTKDPEKVKEQYFTQNPGAFLKMSSFPSYPNEKGTVIISTKDGVICDAFDYDENMHYPLLVSVEGVSLERINFDRPAKDRTNWHSASKESGYATPGYKNSQFSDFGEIENPVTVEPEIFSPDNDGYNDVVNIEYEFPEPGNTANITIYDADGRLIKYLVRNELLGSEGAFSWDGTTEDNQKANIGIYVIYFEAFDLEGNVMKYKKTVVLGGKL